MSLGFLTTNSYNREPPMESRALEPHSDPNNWVAVKELSLSYYIGETLLFTIYTHYGDLI